MKKRAGFSTVMARICCSETPSWFRKGIVRPVPRALLQIDAIGYDLGMPNSAKAVSALLVCLWCPAQGLAQTTPMITDRPDFTESPFVVPPGSIQVEAGLTRLSDGGLSATSGPEALIRWSPGGRFEIRFEPPGYVDGESPRGFTDAALGMKFELGRISAWSVGAIGSLGVPTGGTETSNGRVAPEVIVAAGRDLSDAWTLGTQASVARPDIGDGVALASTLVAGRTLSPRLGAFLEIAAEREPRASVHTLVHLGFTLALSPTLQLDAHASRGMTGGYTASTVGLGVSTRFTLVR